MLLSRACYFETEFWQKRTQMIRLVTHAKFSSYPFIFLWNFDYCCCKLTLGRVNIQTRLQAQVVTVPR